MSIVAPVLTVLVFGTLLIHFALLRMDPAERRRLLVITYAGFLLRLTLAIVFQLVPSLRVTHDDASGYELNAMTMALAWIAYRPVLGISLLVLCVAVTAWVITRMARKRRALKTPS